ncbi:hypothetical protein [Glycomyces sp. MUSA5-2]|uniref:hypothetical protein n=1 Tax=Glycomyces sp. MUSA5-2 TaxID=2053002 RepID=UPI0030096FF2
MSDAQQYELGEGVLHWPNGLVRYLSRNCVALMSDGDSWVGFEDAPVGEVVRLTARVVTVREPILAPDLSRNLAPSIPFVDEVIELGYGALFTGSAYGEGLTAIGVLPVTDVMACDRWLDLDAVYRAHNHIVRLRAETGRTPRFVRQRTPVSGS